MTEWRPVPDWEDLYVVSDQGVVARVVDGERRELAPYVAGNGYPMARLSRHSEVSAKYVHRLVLEAFCGAPAPGDEGCHLNGVRTDNRLENLYWGTHSENIFDAVRHRTHHQAAKTHCKRGHKFSEENIIRTPEGYRRCRTCTRNLREARKIKERAS